MWVVYSLLILVGVLEFAPLAGGFSFVPNANKVDLTPWKYRKAVGAVVVLGVIAIYTLFSPLGIGR